MLVPAVAQGEVIVPHVGSPNVVTPHVEEPAPNPSEGVPAEEALPPVDATAGESEVVETPQAQAAETSEIAAEPSEPLSGPTALGCTGPTRCEKETPEEFQARRNREVKEQLNRLNDARPRGLGFVDSILYSLSPILCPWYQAQRDQLATQMQFWAASPSEQAGAYEKYGVPPALAGAIYTSLELQGLSGYVEPRWCMTSVAP